MSELQVDMLEARVGCWNSTLADSLSCGDYPARPALSVVSGDRNMVAGVAEARSSDLRAT